MPFSLLGYAVAAWLWFALCAAAVWVSIRAIAVVTGISTLASALMLLLPAAVLWLPYGEATPIALVGAAIAAWGVKREKAPAVGLGLGLLAIEPHLALGAWLCVFIAVPRARVSVVAAGVALLGLCVAVHSAALPEYLRGVLPLHALAEVPRPTQYSATWLFYAAGAPIAAALLAGEISYALLLLFGIAAAIRLQRGPSDAVVVLAPIAAAVIGGTFVHASQIALALPFAAMLAMRSSGAVRNAAAICCGVLAVPWLQGGQQQTIVILGVAIASGVVLAVSADRALTLRVAGATSILAILLIFASRSAVVLTRAPAFPFPESRFEYASASWGRYIWKEQSAVRIADWLGKAPTWFALLLLAGSTAVATGAVRYGSAELRSVSDE